MSDKKPAKEIPGSSGKKVVRPKAPPPPMPEPGEDLEPGEHEERRVGTAGDDSKAVVEQFLRESGEIQQDVIEIAARDVEREAHHEQRLAEVKKGKSSTFYSDLIYTLTNLRYEEAEARVLWVNLLTHKMDMSDQLGRNVGIRVAGLDYFKNILGALEEVKIMDASSYIETAQLAVTDPLTGIFNHRYFQDRLLRDINRALDEDEKVSLLMVDIDYFKQYNDINGHIAGDVALKEVASTLRRNLKKDDLVARYGGEEFAVILVGLDREQAYQVADRIRKRIVEMDFPNEQVLPGGQLTISVGLAACPADSDNRGDLIAAADRALYVAKRSGRNQVALPPQDRRGEGRLPLSIKVKYRHAETGDTNVSHEAHSANLSLGGLCLMTGNEVAIGELLYMDVDELDGKNPVIGRVVWKMPQPDGSAQVGIKFVKIDPEGLEQLQQMMGG